MEPLPKADIMRSYVSQLACDCLEVPLKEPAEVAGEKSLGSLAEAATPHDPNPRRGSGFFFLLNKIEQVMFCKNDHHLESHPGKSTKGKV